MKPELEYYNYLQQQNLIYEEHGNIGSHKYTNIIVNNNGVNLLSHHTVNTIDTLKKLWFY